MSTTSARYRIRLGYRTEQTLYTQRQVSRGTGCGVQTDPCADILLMSDDCSRSDGFNRNVEPRRITSDVYGVGQYQTDYRANNRNSTRCVEEGVESAAESQKDPCCAFG